MGFQKIDYAAWPRRPYFEHYHRDVPCWYSMTVDVDISALLPRLRPAHRPAPARPAQKILQRRLSPRVVGETPRGASSWRCGDLFQNLRLLRKDISGVWKRPSPVLLARLLYFRPLPQGRSGRAYSYPTVILTFGLM